MRSRGGQSDGIGKCLLEFTLCGERMNEETPVMLDQVIYTGKGVPYRVKYCECCKCLFKEVVDDADMATNRTMAPGTSNLVT